MTLRRNIFQLAALVLAHLVVDFYGGLLLPLSEPTLIAHYGVSLGPVMMMVAGTAILVNFIQPAASIILPHRPLPLLLIVCPLLAAATTMLGLASAYWTGWVFLVIAALGIGVLHPEAALTAQSIAGRRLGLVTSIFMSAGFFGFSLGSLVAGWWAPRFGLQGFWMMTAPAVVVVAMISFSGLTRPSLPHLAPPAVAASHDDHGGNAPHLPFAWILAIGTMMATALAVIFRLLPVYLVRQFGPTAQADAGLALFMIGLCGAGGAFLWGHLADRHGTCRVMVVVYLLGLIPAYRLFHVAASAQCLLWACLFGVTIGGAFPLSVTLARQSRGLAPRMRLALGIGGAWGVGELTVIISSLYIDSCPQMAATPVLNVLRLTLLLMAAIMAAAAALAWHTRPRPAP